MSRQQQVFIERLNALEQEIREIRKAIVVTHIAIISGGGISFQLPTNISGHTITNSSIAYDNFSVCINV